MAGVGDLVRRWPRRWTARAAPAELCSRAGYVALRRIADFFDIRHNPEPALAGGADLDQAWRDFAGWRVNYDRMLLSLAALTMAPYAPWSSDRSMIERNGSRIRRHNRPGPDPAAPRGLTCRAPEHSCQ